MKHKTSVYVIFSVSAPVVVNLFCQCFFFFFLASTLYFSHHRPPLSLSPLQTPLSLFKITFRPLAAVFFVLRHWNCGRCHFGVDMASSKLSKLKQITSEWVNGPLTSPQLSGARLFRLHVLLWWWGLPYQSAHGELASAVSQVGAPSVRDLAHETRGPRASQRVALSYWVHFDARGLADRRRANRWHWFNSLSSPNIPPMPTLPYITSVMSRHPRLPTPILPRPPS